MPIRNFKNKYGYLTMLSPPIPVDGGIEHLPFNSRANFRSVFGFSLCITGTAGAYASRLGSVSNVLAGSSYFYRCRRFFDRWLSLFRRTVRESVFKGK